MADGKGGFGNHHYTRGAGRRCHLVRSSVCGLCPTVNSIGTVEDGCGFAVLPNRGSSFNSYSVGVSGGGTRPPRGTQKQVTHDCVCVRDTCPHCGVDGSRERLVDT